MKIKISYFHLDKDKNSFPYLQESPYVLLESNRSYGMSSTLQYACRPWVLDMCTNQSRFYLRIHGQFYIMQNLFLFCLQKERDQVPGGEERQGEPGPHHRHCQAGRQA